MPTEIDLTQVQKILVISTTNIGDTILTTPVISSLRERFPSSHISVVVGPAACSLFKGSRTVNEVFAYDKKSSWLKQFQFIVMLRSRKFDLVIDLRNTAIPLLINSRYRNSIFVDRSRISMREKHLMQLDFLFPINGRCENRFNFFTQEEQACALEKVPASSEDNLIVIAPGAGSDLKRWTLSGFAEVINCFLKKDKRIVLVGWERESNLGLELERAVSRPITNLIGVLSLRESAGLIARASLVIANDSAVMHLSHELNRPTVSIFGPTNEKKYAQTGSNRRQVRLHLDCTPCEAAQCRLSRRACLDDLPATSVIRACEELFNHVSDFSFKR
ncbi:MAG: glycosyltransferase family 9 protein [Candidatus Omnitrophica bacterium]|nr:glycosyltransferase family 9 protein [Candidatus Omnitrophota bacterium]